MSLKIIMLAAIVALTTAAGPPTGRGFSYDCYLTKYHNCRTDQHMSKDGQWSACKTEWCCANKKSEFGAFWAEKGWQIDCAGVNTSPPGKIAV